MDKRLTAEIEGSIVSCEKVRDQILERNDLNNTSVGKRVIHDLDDLIVRFQGFIATDAITVKQASETIALVTAVGPYLTELINDNAKMSALKGQLNRNKIYPSEVTDEFVKDGRLAKRDLYNIKAILENRDDVPQSSPSATTVRPYYAAIKHELSQIPACGLHVNFIPDVG